MTFVRYFLVVLYIIMAAIILVIWSVYTAPFIENGEWNFLNWQPGGIHLDQPCDVVDSDNCTLILEGG